MPHWKSACRSLARRPAFAAAAILILGLGIGATTTLFSFLDAVLWKPLPYPNPDRLVAVNEANPAKDQNSSLLAPVRLEEWNGLNQSLEGISGWYTENVTDTSGPVPERLAGIRVAPRYFPVFGAQPLLGRAFLPIEEKFGGPAAAVISRGFWRRRFSEDPGVLGKRLVFTGKGYTIVGVMPDGFAAPTVDLWMPAQMNPFLAQERGPYARFFQGVGRLRPGVTTAQAQADLSRVQAELGRQFPATDQSWSALVGDLKEFRVGRQRTPLTLMFAAVVLLLVIACANAGGLILGQLQRSQRELAIRNSLGASRIEIVSVVMREISVLAAAGAALGVGLAWLGVTLMRDLSPSLPRAEQTRLDGRALLFTIGASVLAIAVSGLIPALEALRTNVSGGIYQAARSQARGRKLFQQGLVATQFAISLVLLLGTGLLVRSYVKLSRVDPGFDARNVITFHVGAEYGEDRQSLGRMQEQLMAELERLPGVQSAGMTSSLPATGVSQRRSEYAMDGSNGDSATGTLSTGARSVSAGYFQALRTPMIRGETCPELRKDLETQPKAVVNQRFVDQYGNGAGVIGRHLHPVPQSQFNPEVVGVIADQKEDGLNAPAYPYVYTCMWGGGVPDPEYVVRVAGDPRQMSAAIRLVVRNVAPSRAVFGVKTLEEHLESALETPRLSSQILVLFAGIALTLAAVGLYSLATQAVTARTKEIGLRVALGAVPRRIVVWLIADASIPVFAGLGVGAALAAVVLRAKLIQSALFEVNSNDALTLLSVAATLVAVSMLGAFLPARRAAAIDPIRALREE